MVKPPLLARLLATTALAGPIWGGASACAEAQEPAVEVTGKPSPSATDDAAAAEGERILFEAETVTRESADSPIVAEGNVRAYAGARYIRADKISFDPKTDIVIAEGNVSITDEDRLETAFAGRVELTGDLRDGVADQFSALLAENARLAGASAVREQGARTRLSKAVYTACDVCNSEGEGKTPTWRLKALRVTRDEERKVVRFHHAFFEIKGVPILYAPFLQSPDPSVERQSGFLTPLIGASSRLGFNIELPYYLAISNSQDATFFPKVTTRDGVLWQGEYRRRDANAYNVFSGGFIDVKDAQAAPEVPGTRWHVFANGHRDFGENWRVGYDVERTSDDTYLRRYDVFRKGDLRKVLDTSESNRLRSQVFLNYRDRDTELRADSFVFQGLRPEDDPELTPYVLPTIDFRQDFKPAAIGGDASVNVNFSSLQRTGGADTRRISASAHWEREHITRNGHRFNAFAEVRGDLYRFEDLDEGTEILPGLAGVDNRSEARFAPSVGLEWSYPLTRRAGGARLFVEPRMQLVASPSNRNPSSIINEDSQSIEYDYSGLFDFNKSTGFDAFEDGQRINAGVATSAVFDNGLVIEGEIGQQFRLQSTDAFLASSGLGEERSDYVGSLNVRYNNLIGVENRFRIDDDTGSIDRAESMAFLNVWRLNANVSYVRLEEENTIAALTRREELNGTARLRFAKNWSTGVAWRQDLLANRLIRQDFSLAYEDDCALFELTYRRNRTNEPNSDLPADNAFLIRFTLRSLVD